MPDDTDLLVLDHTLQTTVVGNSFLCFAAVMFLSSQCSTLSWMKVTKCNRGRLTQFYQFQRAEKKNYLVHFTELLSVSVVGVWGCTDVSSMDVWLISSESQSSVYVKCSVVDSRRRAGEAY